MNTPPTVAEALAVADALLSEVIDYEDGMHTALVRFKSHFVADCYESDVLRHLEDINVARGSYLNTGWLEVADKLRFTQDTLRLMLRHLQACRKFLKDSDPQDTE